MPMVRLPPAFVLLAAEMLLVQKAPLVAEVLLVSRLLSVLKVQLLA